MTLAWFNAGVCTLGEVNGIISTAKTQKKPFYIIGKCALMRRLL